MEPSPSKWTLSRLTGLGALVVALISAIGGFFDFFHLTAPGWVATITALIASVTERAQGGKGKLEAEIAEKQVIPRSYGGSGNYGGPSNYGGGSPGAM